MEISDLKSDETHLTRICSIKNFVRNFKWDTIAPRFYAVRLYAVCMRPFWPSQQERLVCTAAVQPAPDGLYQVGMRIRAYCPTVMLCLLPTFS